MKTPKIFLDSGNPEDTRKAVQLLGSLDGQTTNPSLVMKNPSVQDRVSGGRKLSLPDLLSIYKEIVLEIAPQVTESVSIEVYADWNTKSSEMLSQAQDMTLWHEKVYIKFPTIPEGVKASHEFVKHGGKVNMTLVFDQIQAAAVYTATIGAPKSSYISPFMGRWDDRGANGLDLVKNIKTMFDKFDKERGVEKCHVEILAASLRNTHHLLGSIALGADILTLPLKTIEEWVTTGKKMPEKNYDITTPGLKTILYEDIELENSYESYRISRVPASLLDAGLTKFASDWNGLLKND